MSTSRFTTALSVNIEPDVLARARAAVAALRGTDDAVDGGLSGLVNAALKDALDRLEQVHNGGAPFPVVERLKRGPGL